ncbi:hypothetical protein [Streptosporangium sp. KLBMP 9127]|nr:hypothetical protein [Streptosporangium sp. KLBMP 9127]
MPGIDSGLGKPHRPPRLIEITCLVGKGGQLRSGHERAVRRLRQFERLAVVVLGLAVMAEVEGHPSGELGHRRRRSQQLGPDPVGVGAAQERRERVVHEVGYGWAHQPGTHTVPSSAPAPAA